MYQRDPRHVDVLVKDLGLEQGNSIEKFNTADTGCKLQDVCSSVKIEQTQHACQRMSNRAQQSVAKLERPVNFLKRERQWGQVFSYGRMIKKETTNAGVILLGSHTSKACTRKRKVIASSTAEAELHAAALGASLSKGIGSLLKDLVYEVRPVLAIDAKATEPIFHRQGIGRLKHIDVPYL